MEINMNVNIKVTDEDLDDIMVTALEGGINYWCPQADVVGQMAGETMEEQISKGGKLILVEKYGKEHTLDQEMVLAGLKQYLEDNKSCIDWESDHGKTHLVIDIGMIDSIAADCIIQYAIFGKILYS